MKRIHFLFIFFLLGSLTAVKAADEIRIGELYYKLAGKEATVVGAVNNTSNCKIPSAVSYQNVTYAVTSIGERAFSGRTDLISVNLPECIKIIYSSAFTGCTNLSSVNMTDSLERIGAQAFAGCTSLSSISFPQSCGRNIGNNEVGGVSIEDRAFENCTGLISVDFYAENDKWNSVIISPYAFKGCKNLSSVYIQKSEYKKIPQLIFNGSYAKIGKEAFAGCEKLSLVSFPYESKIGVSAFKDCVSLSSAIFPEEHPYANISDSAFYNCVSLPSIAFESIIDFIGQGAFAGCTSLTSVKTDEIKTRRGAFEGCSSLQNIDFLHMVAFQI